MSNNKTESSVKIAESDLIIFAQNYNRIEQKINNEEYFNSLSISELKSLLSETKSVQGEYKNLEITIKKDGNAIYGAMGSKYFPLVDFDCAGDTTNAGKHYTILVDHKINEFHRDWGEKELKIIQKFYPNVTHLRQFTEYKADTENDLCVYGDTDSRYVNLHKVYSLLFVNEFNNLFPDTSTESGRKELSDFGEFIVDNFYNDLIERTLTEDLTYRQARLGLLKMAHEVTTIRSIFRAKKNYILPIIYKDGKYLNKVQFKSIGVEIKKGGLDKITKGLIERLLQFYLLDGKDVNFIRLECLKIIKYLREKGQKSIISRIGSVNDLHEIYFDEEEKIYKSNKNHQSMKVALSWYNFIHRNNLSGIYKAPFNGQKMKFYYDVSGQVMGVPDDVDINTVKNLPLPDYVKMVKEIIVRNLYKYISDKPAKLVNMKDVDNFIAGIRTINDI